MKDVRKIFLLLILFALGGCEDIGKATFGEVAQGKDESKDEGKDSDGSDENVSSLSFSGLDSINEVTDSTARLEWSSHADAVAYQVHDVTSNTTFVTIVMAPATSYDISGLTPSTLYKFRVRAMDSEANLDSNTNDLQITTNFAPSIPSSLSLISPSQATSNDKTPTIRVGGVKSGDTITLYTDDSCSNQVGSEVAEGEVVDITTVELDADDYSFHARATNSQGSASDCSSVDSSVNYTLLACPDDFGEFVFVPGNSGLGVDDFCVMKYEAKAYHVGDEEYKADGGFGESNHWASLYNPLTELGNYQAHSVTEARPWVRVSQEDAKDACEFLGEGYDLISNPEWMTIARNIETNLNNWSGEEIGSGTLNRGHSNGSNSLAAPSDESDPDYHWYETGSTSWINKRTHTLSNEEEIWDIAGNVWNWVDWSLGGGLTDGPKDCDSSWEEWHEKPDDTGCTLAAEDYQPANPEGISVADYDADQGLGRIYGGSGGAARRGGVWGNGDSAGAFTLALANGSGASASHIGFRCVFRP